MKKLVLFLAAAALLMGQHPPAPSQIQGVSGVGPISVTSTGTQTPGACVVIDAHGDHVADPSCLTGGTTNSTITTTSTSGTTYIGTVPSLAAYATDRVLNWDVGGTNCNGGATTINLNGIATVSIKQSNGNDPQTYQCPAHQLVPLRFDGTVFRMLAIPTPIGVTFNYQPGTVLPTLRTYNAGTGRTTILTCPPGKYCLVGNAWLYNTAGTTTTVFSEILHGGTYYQVGAVNNIATNGSGTNQNFFFSAFILLPGDSVNLNASQAGINIYALIQEWNIATSTITPYWMFGAAAGENLLTPPIAAPAVIAALAGITYIATVSWCWSTATVANTLISQLVPNGQTASNTYGQYAGTTVGNGWGYAGPRSVMAIGDSMYLNWLNADAAMVCYLPLATLPSPLP